MTNYASLEATAKARMNSLMASSSGKMSSMLTAAQARANTDDAPLVDFRVKYQPPRMYDGQYLAFTQLDEVAYSLHRMLKQYALEARGFLAEPTVGWKDRPSFTMGVPGVADIMSIAKHGMRRLLMTPREGLTAGAYVEAGEQVTTETGEQSGGDDANWHYIWLNNGVEVRGDIAVKSRPSRTGKGRPAMRFQVPYKPATTPGSLHGRAPGKGGEMVFATHVAGHKIEARDFVGTAAAALQTTFTARAVDTINKAILKHQEPEIDRVLGSAT